MRNIFVGIIILTIGGYYLANSGSMPKVQGGSTGNIAGYASAPQAPVTAAKTAGGRILD